MSKKYYSLLSILVLASMLLAACAPAATATQAPVPTQPPAPVATEAPKPTDMPKPTDVPAATEAPKPTDAPVAKLKICEVTDTGGIDDRSFNATAWKGVEDAVKQFGVEGKYLESQQQTDYEKNINASIDDKCDLVVTVGFLLADATAAAAKANPNEKFAIVDSAYDPVIPNVLGLVFSTDQAAFLTGYIAAASTKTGKVGTFGGIKIPSVTSFMDGFALGVKYHNEKKGTKVEVLGWDVDKQDGLFTGNFESTDDGRNLGKTLMDEGADVIMPVAGPVGLGTAAAVKEHKNAWIVGVDTDWTVSSPDYKDIILTSVQKNMDVAILAAVKSVVDGKFAGGVYVGTLENGGVGVPSTSVMDDTLKAEVDALKAEIIAGTVKTTPAAK